MASSSTSSIHKRFKYDVFLSFRGEDVRKTFIDHLYAALDRQGIKTFRDDRRLEKGEMIDNELIKSIRDSKIFIIVFSLNYASSSWCLNELVEIIECQKNTEQIAYPVFYDVDPSEVRKQRGSYGEALAKHNKKEVDQWREALQEAANLAGYDVKNTADGHEAEAIKQIVEQISNRLRSTCFLRNDEKLVGMEARMLDILSCLEIGSDDVRMIGIKGMGGAGKTTLARAIFERISFNFEGVSFVENVREKSKASEFGLRSLQEEILSNVLKERYFTISSLFEGKLLMRNRLCCVKALIVLDDVDDLSQLEALAGACDWFKPGSRIIITTRDDKVLVAHGVERKRDVNLLSEDEAMCLFNMYACKGDIPIERYEHLSLNVVRYASGLPLTVKVLGSLLRGEGESVWIDVLNRLKTIPLKQTLDILELSYNSLEDDHKEIFLDVACLLARRASKKMAFRMLESCGFHATYGLTVLEQKSLITFRRFLLDDDDCVFLDMHDHIKEMGQNIVRRKHPDEPNKHSRLWIDKEIEDILVNNLVIEATRCLYEYSNRVPEIIMKGFGNMKNLKFLQVLNDPFTTSQKFDEASQYFPNSLQYLHWWNYPFCYLPQRFQANNLVALEMPESKIEQLWEGGERKVFHNLKFLDLSDSDVTILDLGLTPALEVLKLTKCHSLSKLDMSVGCLKLRSLDLSYLKLTKLDLRHTPNLEVLCLEECSDLLELDMPIEYPRLRSLRLYMLRLTKLDLRLTPNLEVLELIKCHYLSKLDMSIGCPKLRSLYLSYIRLTKLDLGLTPNLQALQLKTCHYLMELDILVGCPKLRSLDLSYLKLTKLNLRQNPNLEVLNIRGCRDLFKLQMPVECPKLRILHINNLSLMKLDLGLTPNLKVLKLENCEKLSELAWAGSPKMEFLNLGPLMLTKLDLRLCSNLKVFYLSCTSLVELNMPLDCLKLRSLDLRSSVEKLDLGLIPNLEKLDVCRCFDLVDLNVECLKLRSLELSLPLFKTLDPGLVPNVETLYLHGVWFDLVEPDIRIAYRKVTSLKIYSLKVRTLDLRLCPDLIDCQIWCSEFKTIDLARTPKLKVLKLHLCHALKELHMCVGCLKELAHLELVGCSGLKSFVLNKDQESHEFCPSVESLDILTLDSNHGMPKIPLSCLLYNEQASSFARDMKKLISLGSCRCSNLKNILGTVDWFPNLRTLKIHCSIQVEPDDKIECIEELKFSCTDIKSLPLSICFLVCLKSLKLEHCMSLETLQDVIGGLECLEKLHLSFTRIRHLTNEIFRLKRLKSLQLVCCSLLEKLPEDLDQLECLEDLLLQECKLLRDIPNNICKMKSLKWFHLPYCAAVEKLPEEIGDLKSLIELNIVGTGIRQLPESIISLKEVRIIRYTWHLDMSGFTFTSVQRISEM